VQASRKFRFNRRPKSIFKPAQPSDEHLHTLAAAMVVFAGGEVRHPTASRFAGKPRRAAVTRISMSGGPVVGLRLAPVRQGLQRP